jgi:hypothetical protein
MLMDVGEVTLNVVSVSQTTEFLLTSSVPRVETDLTKVGMKCDRMNLDTKSCNVLLLKFTGDVSLDKGCLGDVSHVKMGVGYLSSATIANEDELESCDVLLICHVGIRQESCFWR